MRLLDGITKSIDMSLSKSEGQGSLACCSPWGRKESDMTEQLNKNNMWNLIYDINQYICETKTDSQIPRTDFWLPKGR